MLTPEQLMAAQKAHMDTLLGLTHKAFEGVEKLVELNMQLARAALSDSADTAKAALSVKDAQELLALQAELLQPAAEKAAAYNRSLYDIAQSANAEWIKAAEAQMASAQKNLHAMIDTAGQGAPAGSEDALALVKSAVSAANHAFEDVHKAARQAADIAQAHLQAMAGTTVAATKAATKAAVKPATKPATKGGRRSR
ncbi:MAG: phasin family protein [Betaproteobacteria bacterium]|nr:phasin family protein [Betaproteobacteria bacterium]NBU49697.1 phasin family protein [Betaproteobacteria bacterium]